MPRASRAFLILTTFYPLDDEAFSTGQRSHRFGARELLLMQENLTNGFMSEPFFPVDGCTTRGGSSRGNDGSRECVLPEGSPSTYSSTSPQCSRPQIMQLPSGEAEASTSRGPSPRRRKLRGSCDFCTRRKRKCDGDGVNRCSLCVAKNQAVCHYSVRLPTGPKPQTPPPTASNSSSVLARSGHGRPTPEGREGKEQHHKPWGSVSEEKGVDQYPAGEMGEGDPSCTTLLPFKRARMSPSPATGLIGLQENVYIGDFFRALGFLPFTDESDIRKAMIATMFSKLQQQGSAEDDHGGGSIIPSMRSAEIRAATCVLWCTVALGYLVEGRPKDLVVGYTNLAREALSECFDDGSVGTARAFISMAILQNFLGDEMKYRKHLEFAKSIVAALPPGVIPEELKVTILHMRVCDTFWLDPERFGTDCWELKTECNTLRKECSEIPDELLGKAKKPNIFRRTDLYRWLIQLDVRMGHSFHKDMFDVGLYDAVSNKSTLANQNRPIPEIVADDGPQASISGGGESLDPPPPGEMSRQFAANALREFNALDNVAEIADIRDGVGELYVRSIMAYVYRLEGRLNVSFDNLWRCAEVIIKHPGLCRFTIWKHTTHCILKAMAIRGHRDKYMELRDAYNSVVDEPGMLKIPPYEEFTAVTDICDGFFCRSICSDQIHDVDEVSTPSSENRIEELPSVEENFPDLYHSVTPPPPPSLKNASSLSLETPHDGKSIAPVEHPSQSQSIASGFSSVGVSTTGTSLNVPGKRFETQSVVWNTTVPDGGSSSDWYSGTSSSSSSNNNNISYSRDISSDAAVASNGNRDRLGFREEQMMPLPIATTTAADGVDASDNASWIDAVDAILGEADLEDILACDNTNCRVDQSWT